MGQELPQQHRKAEKQDHRSAKIPFLSRLYSWNLLLFLILLLLSLQSLSTPLLADQPSAIEAEEGSIVLTSAIFDDVVLLGFSREINYNFSLGEHVA